MEKMWFKVNEFEWLIIGVNHGYEEFINLWTFYRIISIIPVAVRIWFFLPTKKKCGKKNGARHFQKWAGLAGSQWRACKFPPLTEIQRGRVAAFGDRSTVCGIELPAPTLPNFDDRGRWWVAAAAAALLYDIRSLHRKKGDRDVIALTLFWFHSIVIGHSFGFGWPFFFSFIHFALILLVGDLCVARLVTARTALNFFIFPDLLDFFFFKFSSDDVQGCNFWKFFLEIQFLNNFFFKVWRILQIFPDF